MATSFGKLALQGFLTAKEQQQEDAQFARKLAVSERQDSLANQIQIAQLQQKQREFAYRQAQDAQDLATKGFSLSPGETRFDIEGNPIATLPPRTSTSDFTLSQGQKRYDSEGNLIASLPPKPDKSNEFNADKVREKIATQFAAYKDITNPTLKTVQFNLLKKNTNELINKKGLKTDVGNIWSRIKKVGLAESINVADEKRQKKGKPPLSPEDKTDLELYFTTRYQPSETKPIENKNKNFTNDPLGLR